MGMGMFTASDCPPQWGSTFHEQTDSLGLRQGLSERVMVSGPRPRHVWLQVQSLHAPPRVLQALKDLASHSSAEAKQTCHKLPQLTSVRSTLNGFWKSESFSLIPSSWAICRGGKASHPLPSPASCSPAGHPLHGGTQAQGPGRCGPDDDPKEPRVSTEPLVMAPQRAKAYHRKHDRGLPFGPGCRQTRGSRQNTRQRAPALLRPSPYQAEDG